MCSEPCCEHKFGPLQSKRTQHAKASGNDGLENKTLGRFIAAAESGLAQNLGLELGSLVVQHKGDQKPSALMFNLLSC